MARYRTVHPKCNGKIVQGDLTVVNLVRITVRMVRAISVIVDVFGGLRPFSRAVGRSSASTAQYWREKGFLPRGERAATILALRERGLCVDRAERLVDNAIAGLEIPDAPDLQCGRPTQ